MTAYARVERGVVRELMETDQRIEDLYHPDLLWVGIRNTPGICPGWVVGPEGFVPPEPETVATATPVIDVAELGRQVDELREQIRMLASNAADQHPKEV